MRLVCPSCEAKYEVPDDAIPDTGRDVQCANCGHAWFQMRARAAPGAAEALAPMPDPVTAAVTAAVPEPMPEPEPVPTPEPMLEPEPTAAEAAVTGSDVLADFDPSPDAVPADAPDPAGQPEGSSAAEADAQDPGPAASPDTGDAQQAPAVLPEDAPSPTDDAQGQGPDAASAIGPDLGGPTLAADEPSTDPSPDAVLDATGPARAPLYAVPDAVPDALPDPVPEAATDVSAEETGPDGPDQADVADTGADTVAYTEAPVTVAAAATGAAAYAVDESVLAILREEAEREATARRADAQSLETQTDMGLSTGSKRKKSGAKAEAKPAARRDLLPDVEEINSTLRPSEPEADAEVMGPGGFQSMPARQGFRGGFLTIMTVAILGATLYSIAPWLETALPALSGPLQAYVTLIDSARLHLDGLMRSATVAINGG